jgi:hypothetical protein
MLYPIAVAEVDLISRSRERLLAWRRLKAPGGLGGEKIVGTTS